MNFEWVKIEIYVPKENLEAIREALNQGGAGVIGNYDNCLSMYEVKGMWRPLEGADPYDGEIGVLSHGSELKIEARCPMDRAETTVKRLKEAHPYDEPVINVIPLITF